MEESKSKVRREKLISKRKKLRKVHKIDRIYELKLNPNDIGQKIRKKTSKLT